MGGKGRSHESFQNHTRNRWLFSHNVPVSTCFGLRVLRKKFTNYPLLPLDQYALSPSLPLPSPNWCRCSSTLFLSRRLPCTFIVIEQLSNGSVFNPLRNTDWLRPPAGLLVVEEVINPRDRIKLQHSPPISRLIIIGSLYLLTPIFPQPKASRVSPSMRHIGYETPQVQSPYHIETTWRSNHNTSHNFGARLCHEGHLRLTSTQCSFLRRSCLALRLVPPCHGSA